MSNNLRLVYSDEPQPVSDGATLLDRLQVRVRQWIGEVCTWVRLPGAIAPVAIHDHLTGDTITVTVWPWFTKLNINGREYYFDRITGRFDGTGQAVGVVE